jgi:hypothetical protein
MMIIVAERDHHSHLPPLRHENLNRSRKQIITKMKKIILFVAGTLLSVAMVNAQTQDSTRSKSSSQSGSTQTPSANYQNYPTKDMKRIKSSEIPASLRTTLQGPEYSGWENSPLYYNSTTGEYSYQPTGSGSSSSSSSGQKNNSGWYRFDKNGKRIPDSNK